MSSSYVYFFVLLCFFIGHRCVNGQTESKQCPNPESILPCRCQLRDEEYQVWCSHSHLLRVLEGLKVLGQFITHPIDELILENNNLPSLPGKSFLPLQVMRLMLRYNNLERVSNGWLSGLEDSLMELFIVEPELRSLPEESLIKQNRLEAVTLHSNAMKRLPQFSNLPNLRYVQSEGSNIVELSPRHFRNLPRLEKVHVTGSTRLDRLEAGLFEDLPRLSFVNISYCGVTWMHLRSFSQLPALKEFSLEGNNIQDSSMVGRAVRELRTLEHLKLDFNQISILGEAAFVDLPSLRRLSLSNNEIGEIQHGAFDRVPALRTLDLSYNRIRRVHPEAFVQRSGIGIEELLITNNDISHVAELSTILDTLPHLTFLDMSYNHLEAISFGSLRGHSTLEYLRLDYNKLHIIDREAFQGMSALRELRLKNNSLSDRLEAPFWNLPSLKGLDLSGNYFRRVTPRLLSNIPQLRKVDFSSNRINFVDPEAFIMVQNLEHVNVSHNALINLHPATFRHLLNLYELDVSFNKLLEFVPGLPRGLEHLFMAHNGISDIPTQPAPDLDLPQLKLLDLSWNSIHRITPGVFRTVPQLRKLYLGRNALQVIDEGSLNGLDKLQVLDVRENRISKFNPNVLKDNKELVELNLRENRIDVLTADVFSGAEKIRLLDLSRNQLTEIYAGAFVGTRELEEVDISHNQLVQLPGGLHGMKKLRKLDVTDNRLNTIHPDVLNSFVSLEELKLSHNYIQQIRRGAFDSLHNLRILELDNNEIQDVESKAIHALPQLKNLKLGRNKLQEIPNAAFSHLPSLQIAELQENDLRLIGASAFHHVPHLLMLNVSRNQFVSLEDAGLRSLRWLEMLDVSYNQLAQVSSPSLARMEWLVELRMDNNKICAVQGATFNDMPRLRVLSLRHNRLTSFPEHVMQKLRGNIAVLDLDGNPLACSCSMLWMKVWLQEQQLLGPKCMDGSLLRDIRLSRQECQVEGRYNDPVAAGCEPEYGSPWTTTRQGNKSKQHAVKNHLAPSPEESDYFYDEYIDYPYNETFATATSKPGGIPVLYAASKNKTKKPSDTPKGVVGSPSSSGFTFFGLPIPSLNLNSLLGTGSSRVDKGKNKPPEVGAVGTNAERKVAIVNKPLNNDTPLAKPTPTKTIPPPPPPRDLPERNKIVGMMPPVHPEIHSGGFIPLLPGSHGFSPIDPTLGVRKEPTTVETMNITPTLEKIISTTEKSPILETTNIESTTVLVTKMVNTPLKEEIFISTSKPSTTTAPLGINEKIEEPTEEYELNDEYIQQGEESRGDPYSQIVKLPSTTTTSPNSSFEDIFQQVVDVPGPSPSSTTRPFHSTETLPSSTLINLVSTMAPMLQPHTDSKPPIGTPLSVLLVPGGQIPHQKTGGSRQASITKVSNPISTSPAPVQSYLDLELSSTGGNFDFNDMADDHLSPMAQNGEDRSAPAADMNWYFANYNKSSNLQQFVGGEMFAASRSTSVHRYRNSAGIFLANMWLLCRVSSREVK